MDPQKLTRMAVIYSQYN